MRGPRARVCVRTRGRCGASSAVSAVANGRGFVPRRYTLLGRRGRSRSVGIAGGVVIRINRERENALEKERLDAASRLVIHQLENKGNSQWTNSVRETNAW